MYIKKKPITCFEEARRAIKNILLNVSTWKERPTLVDHRTKSPEKEIDARDILQDLYIANLEDLEDNRDYWVQVEEFRRWFSGLGKATQDLLVKEMVLVPGYVTPETQARAEELRQQYFPGARSILAELRGARKEKES